MKHADVIIVGGSAAGIEAARTARQFYPEKSVAVIRRERRTLVPCGIPYVMGTLDSIEKDVMPDGLLGDAELVLGDVVALDRDARTLQLAGGRTMGYEKLILATGSQPLVPPIPGVDLENVFTVRKDMQYLETLRSALARARSVVIVGGGFIGAEFADECHKMGLDVTIVELLEHCLYMNCDVESCIELEDRLKETGVHVNTDSRVQAIVGDGTVTHVECIDGRRLDADVVILAVGVKPNTELATDSGLRTGDCGGIVVDQFMRTADPDVFAIGDCAEKHCFFTNESVPIWLASVATREARIAAANLYDPRRRRNQGTLGVFSTMIAGTAVAAAGLTERTARKAGFELVIGEASAVDKHPGTMPEARTLSVKLIFNAGTRKLMGGEACGGPSAGETANVIAQAIASGSTAEDLAISHIGTHPALTASPVLYQVVNAAEDAVGRMRPERVATG